MKHIRFVPAALFVFLFLLLPANVFAQSANGTATGRVSNAATQKYLASVSVADKETKRAAVTDADGVYILVLPEGERTLVVTYGGLDTQEMRITVAAGKTVTTDVSLTSADYDKDLVKLDKFVVSGEREGRMASIAQQKASDVLVTMISSDEFPNVAGANLGDFLRNIPGLDIMDNGSDPRDIMFRGMDSQMSGVTSDGLRMANAAGTDGNTRSFNLDQISIQNYETIEVFKTPTAAMSADSGAGSVNLVSKSAFTLKRARISFQAGGMLDSANTHIMRYESSGGDEFAIRPVGSFSYQNSFLRNRLGVTFTANYNDISTWNQSVTDSRRTSYDWNASQAIYYPVGPDSGVYSRNMNYSMGPGMVRRTSFSLNLDYKLTPYLKVYSNNQINTSYISGGQQSLSVGNVDPNTSLVTIGGPNTGLLPDWTPYSVTAVTGANDVRANTIQDAANSKSGVATTTNLEVLNKIGRGTMFSIGAEYKRGGWKINADAGVSLSTNHYTTQDGMSISQAEMYLRGIDYRIDHPGDSNYPILVQLNGPDIYNLANYVSRAASGNNAALVSVAGTNRNVPVSGANLVIPGVSTNVTYPNVQMARGDYLPFKVSNGRWLNTKDKFTTAKFDARRTFFTRIPMYLQVGGMYREQERHTDKNGQSRWFFTGSTEELQQVLESVKSPDLNASFGPYQPVPYFSLPYINEYFERHPEKFREDVVWRTETERVGDKFSRERVSSGYAMFNIKLWRLGLLLGARYERTDQSGRGPITNNDATAVRASEMLMDYVRGYGYADITSAYNDTVMNPLTGLTGQSLVTNFAVNQEQALELTRLRFANIGTVDKQYDDWFPNVQMKFDITKNIMIRASYNKAIARQAFDRLLPGYSVSIDSNSFVSVTMNNPNLKPIYFDNYDVAVELYTRRGGSVSLGYYYKNVENYTGNFTTEITADGVYDYDFSDYIGGNLTQPVNIGGAKHWGVEFSISQRLEIISKYLKDFQIYGAYTYQEGETSSNFNSTNALTGWNVAPSYGPVLKLIPKKFKINLSYSHKRINASLSYNWTGRYASGGPYRINTDISGDPYGYLYNDTRGTFDGSIQYAFYKNYRFYVEAKNFTNEPVRTYFVNRKWSQNYNVYGSFVYFGIKGNF